MLHLRFVLFAFALVASSVACAGREVRDTATPAFHSYVYERPEIFTSAHGQTAGAQDVHAAPFEVHHSCEVGAGRHLC